MGAVSVELCGVAEMEECRSTGWAEAEEPCRARAVSMEVHRQGPRRWRSDAGQWTWS